MNRLATGELNDAVSRPYVKDLIFPIGKFTPFPPGEVIVRGMVCMRVRFAWFRRLMTGTCHKCPKESLRCADRAVMYTVFIVDKHANSVPHSGFCVKLCNSWQTFILIYSAGFDFIHHMKAIMTFAAVVFSLATSVSAVAYDVAAYIWPAYHPDPRWAELGIFKDGKGEWQNLYESTKRYADDYQGVKPLWGYEDESDPMVVARKIDAATAAGINIFIYDWYWYGGRPFLQDALEQGFLRAPNNGRMKFFIMYANHDVNGLWNNKLGGEAKKKVIWPARISDNDWEKIVGHWIKVYFACPNYYAIKGCPVVMLYDTDLFVEWDGLDKAKERFAYLRAEAKKAGYPGVHIMALANFKSVQHLGVDSLTLYNWLYETWDRVNDVSLPQLTYRQWGEMAMENQDKAKAFASSFGAKYFPNITVGWDTNARYPASDTRNMVHGSNPSDFGSFARRVKDWADANISAGDPKLITINSWNEWTEGTYLEPDSVFGYGYLNALWRVFVRNANGLD